MKDFGQIEDSLSKNDALIVCQKLAEMVYSDEISVNELVSNFKDQAKKIIHSTLFIKQTFIKKSNTITRRLDWDRFLLFIKKPKPKYINIQLSHQQTEALREYTIFVLEILKDSKKEMERILAASARAHKEQEHLPYRLRKKIKWSSPMKKYDLIISMYTSNETINSMRESVGLQPLEDKKCLYLSPDLFPKERVITPKQTYNKYTDKIDYSMDWNLLDEINPLDFMGKK